MSVTLILFVTVATILSIISSYFLINYVVRRNSNTQEPDICSREHYIREQHVRKDAGLWKFLIAFGLIFATIPAAGLIFQNSRTKDWIETPAVISELQTFRSGTERKQSILVSYEFGGQSFENINTNTSVKQCGIKNPVKAGQITDILVNPNMPTQIDAFNGTSYGIQFTLLLVGLLICFFGIFNLIKTRAGKSKWRSANEPPVVLTEEEELKSRIGGTIFVTVFLDVILFVTYRMASLPVFLLFVAWLLFIVFYGVWMKRKKSKQ